MTWKMFIEGNDQTFRREFGVRNDEGERDVLGWMTYEGMDYANKTEVGVKEMSKWAYRAGMSCAVAAEDRNRR